MLRIETECDDLKQLARALGREVDGKKLRRGFATEIRKALKPAVDEAKAGILAMGSGGLPHAGEPLRAAIARQVKAQARLSGRSAGAKVRVSKRGMPRGFVNAPKRTNRVKGWRHPVHGRDLWVHQLGRPGWFDDPLKRNRRRYRDAVVKVMEETARRIVRKV